MVCVGGGCITTRVWCCHARKENVVFQTRFSKLFFFHMAGFSVKVHGTMHVYCEAISPPKVSANYDGPEFVATVCVVGTRAITQHSIYSAPWTGGEGKQQRDGILSHMGSTGINGRGYAVRTSQAVSQCGLCTTTRDRF